MNDNAARELLQPQVLARLGNLELIAQRIVQGATQGLHRSPRFGFSQEFAEYKAYNEGDDTRFIDWNVFARTGRSYIKRFEGETSTAITLMLDASASMGFGGTVSKLFQAKCLLASLAWMAKEQHDAAGLMVFDGTLRHQVPARGSRASFVRVLAALQQTSATGDTDIVGMLEQWLRLQRRRGIVVLASDLYCDPTAFSRVLQSIRFAGHDIGVFHLYDPEESAPTLERVSALQDMESGESIIVDPAFLRAEYRQRFSAHGQAMADAARHAGARFIACSTHDPLDQTLARWLEGHDSGSAEVAP